jgi:zinc protease
MFLIASLSETARALCRTALVLACGGAVGWAHASLPIQHWTQPSGARVYLVESHAIPMVDVQIDIDAGSRRDPAAQAGLASVMAVQMANGTLAEPQGQGPYPKALDENQIGEAWADLGASFGGSAGGDRMSFALRSLSYPDLLDKAVALAARQMAHPAFPEAMWLRDRERISASIRESLTKPGTVVQQRFAQAVYGTHPYGFRATPESLSRIGAQDLKNLHAQALRSCRATVSVVGALTRAQTDALVQRLLAQWPRESGCPSLPPVPEVASLAVAQDLPRLFCSAGGQPHFGRWWLCLAPDRAGARKTRPELQRLQRFCPRPARRGFHGGPANSPRPGRTSCGRGPRGGAGLCA